MTKTVLCLVDFSKISAEAALYSFHFAHSIDATLLLAHVSTCFKNTSADYEKLTKIKDSLIAKTEMSDQRVKCVVGFGDFSTYVETFIKRYNVDLILIGTRQNSKKAFGSHACALLSRNLRVPLLVIPPKFSFSPVKLVAYTVDSLKEEVTKPLSSTQMLAKQWDATLFFVFVEKHKKTNKEAFEQIINKTVDYNPKKCFVICSEDILEGLNDFSEENNVDLLVMVKRKRGYFQKFVHESMTKAMSMKCKKPLLVYHE